MSSESDELESLEQPNISKPSTYAALKIPGFRFYITGRVLAMIALQMQTVVVGWELYDRTGSPMALGWVGLAEFLPVLLLTLPAGQLADQMDRKTIVRVAQLVLALTSMGLAYLSITQGPILYIYACLMLASIARSFGNPASSSWMPQLVPASVFSNAAVWNSSVFQLACVLGPALGGIMIGVFHHAVWAYGFNALLFSFGLTILSFVPAVSSGGPKEAVTFKTLAAGFQFVKKTETILAAITLDMFAVLLGGVTTLLPIFAKDILHVGPTGLGWLRAAPSIGALLISLWIAHRPPLKRAGVTLLWMVAGFGLTIIVFGLSRWFWLSMVMLILNGALDNISVIIRQTLVQVQTPNALRGRVSAINSVFIGSSNELGGFESGLTAQLFGPVGSAVLGGIGTLSVVSLVAVFWPALRRIGGLHELTEAVNDAPFTE